MMRIKICGITREDDAEAAVALGVDSLGFVVGVPSSPRNLPLQRAKQLASKIPRGVSRVAVTVFRDEARLQEICSELDVDFVQLHGNLSGLHGLDEGLPSGKCVIGAVDAGAPNALSLAVEYSGRFGAVLLDTAGKGGVGGTGVLHDWSLSSRIRDAVQPASLILAGGLTPENVGEAIRRVRPSGVDVSSGVESRPGVKDRDKMREFVIKVRETRL